MEPIGNINNNNSAEQRLKDTISWLELQRDSFVKSGETEVAQKIGSIGDVLAIYVKNEASATDFEQFLSIYVSNLSLNGDIKPMLQEIAKQTVSAFREIQNEQKKELSAPQGNLTPEDLARFRATWTHKTPYKAGQKRVGINKFSAVNVGGYVPEYVIKNPEPNPILEGLKSQLKKPWEEMPPLFPKVDFVKKLGDGLDSNKFGGKMPDMNNVPAYQRILNELQATPGFDPFSLSAPQREGLLTNQYKRVSQLWQAEKQIVTGPDGKIHIEGMNVFSPDWARPTTDEDAPSRIQRMLIRDLFSNYKNIQKGVPASLFSDEGYMDPNKQFTYGFFDTTPFYKTPIHNIIHRTYFPNTPTYDLYTPLWGSGITGSETAIDMMSRGYYTELRDLTSPDPVKRKLMLDFLLS